VRFVSTRKGVSPASISEAISSGLAPDGGLFIPENWPPELTAFSSYEKLQYPADMSTLLRPFFDDKDDVLASPLDEICQKAFNFPLVLKHLDDSTGLLELFHGPTNAFKDFGARFLALAIDAIEKSRTTHLDSNHLVLVATSGDTGGAVASAFCGLTQIPVAILYPHGKISMRQEKQLTCWGPQVRAFAVQGDFDDCQRIVKEAFLSPHWRSRKILLSANSINLARLLPQMGYFCIAAHWYFREKGRPAGFIVPSGNLGNGVAATWAHRLGAPISQIIFAHNANHAVSDFFSTGVWEPQPTIATLANAMDVGAPSNFERLRALGDLNDLQLKVGAVSVSDQEIRETIVRVNDEYGEVVCPHTAVGFRAREKIGGRSENWVIAATAHPSKFESIVEPLIGRSIELPKNLSDLMQKPNTSELISPDLRSLEKALFIREK
jgi:threonine synthase